MSTVLFKNIQCIIYNFLYANQYIYIGSHSNAQTHQLVYEKEKPIKLSKFSHLLVAKLQWVLHDWSKECIKILKNCKKVIPPREEGGKVIIIDMVVEEGSSNLKRREVQALFDLYMTIINGIERDEQEWKSIFFEAGFSDYKISPVLGARSIIEVYP